MAERFVCVIDTTFFAMMSHKFTKTGRADAHREKTGQCHPHLAALTGDAFTAEAFNTSGQSV